MHLEVIDHKESAAMPAGVRAVRPVWTFAIVSMALFMVVLDNLVVTTALPSIRADLVVAPLAALRRTESRGPARRLDLPGVALGSLGLLGVVYGIVRGQGDGWTSPHIVAALAAGAVLLAAFVVWERRTPTPMLPL